MTAPDLLREAAQVIDQRGASRDLPQERSMRRAVSAFNALSGQTLTETQGWLFVAVLKLSRALAGAFQRDDLLDAAAYIALALECELAEPPDRIPELTPRQVGDHLGPLHGFPGISPPEDRARLLQQWRAAEIEANMASEAR